MKWATVFLGNLQFLSIRAYAPTYYTADYFFPRESKFLHSFWINSYFLYTNTALPTAVIHKFLVSLTSDAQTATENIELNIAYCSISPQGMPSFIYFPLRNFSIRICKWHLTSHRIFGFMLTFCVFQQQYPTWHHHLYQIACWISNIICSPCSCQGKRNTHFKQLPCCLKYVFQYKNVISKAN